MKKSVIVIGAGIAGLAAAIRLSAQGYQVTVFESNPTVGGKVSWIKQDGYQWGLGASLLTFPELVDELFELCGKRPSDYYEYIRLDPITKYFYEDGTTLNAYADKNKLAGEIAEKTKEKKETVLSYLQYLHEIFDLTEHTFLRKSLHRWNTYLTQNAADIFFTNPMKMGLFRTIHKKNASVFKDKRIVQLFDRYATYNGSNPYKAPSVLNIIAHPEFNRGGYIMKDGMPSITQNLYKLAQEMGVVFHLNTTVDEIVVQHKKAVGVKVAGAVYRADTIVCNMDINFAYSKLLSHHKEPVRYTRQEKSTSVIIFYWGMKKKFPQLDVHNILFSSDYEQEFRAISRGEISKDPTVYIFVSSKVNQDHAAPDGENWFTLINVPHDSGQDWEAYVEKYRHIMTEKINRLIGEDIRPYISTEVVNHPQKIREVTQSYMGALYGNSSNKVMSSFLRHPNFSSDIKDLYFCGGSVHPGGGVPVCLLSAKITADLIQSDNEKRKQHNSLPAAT